MATGSISDEWMYSEVLDDDLPTVATGDELTRRASVDSTDLLDDVLTLPASMSKQDTDPEELSFVQEPENGAGVHEDSGSARYNAEQMAKTVQARIESNKTSQSIASQCLSIYSREPNKRNSVYIGNMTWWTTDMDILHAVRDVGLGEVKIIKFFENRTNGQSKGYVMAELANEALALGAPDKLQSVVLHGKTLIAAYAGRMTVAQFEAKCQGKSFPEKQPIPTKPQHRTPAPVFRPPVPTGTAFPPPGLPPPTVPGLRPPDIPPFNAFPSTLPRPPTLPPLPPNFDPTGLAAAFKPGPAAPHLNPAFLQEMSQGNNVAELFAKAAAHFQVPSAASSIKNRPSDEEVADANQRNRAISSSAISRAMSDANAGDYDSAVDTLKMAITLIKQSVTASSESSQMLIQSLQDCLHGIEHQAGNKRSKPNDRHESRERRSAHSRSSSSKHRDRSRERRR